MAFTSQQRSWCVLEFHKTNSVVTVQCAFKLKFNVNLPTNKSILKWHRNFIERGCICDQRKGHSGRPSVLVQVVHCVRESFLRSPRKSMCRVSRALKVLQSTVRKILQKRLQLHPYKLQLVQKLHTEDKETWHAFCGNLQALMENDDDLLAEIIFSDEATFKWKGQQIQYEDMGEWKSACTLEVECDSKTQCVLCHIKADCVRPVHLWGTKTVTGWRYLEMLTSWLIPQQAVERHDYLFQQDGAPPLWHLTVRTFLNKHLPNRWIGCTGQNDQVFCKWPSRSPDLTVCDFFLWCYVKDRVYVPPLPATVDELQQCITGAVDSVKPDVLQRVWCELDYRIDVCWVTKGGHIECVWYHMKLYEFMQL